ncbi:uncharacterized protein [Narcine bancroftii]
MKRFEILHKGDSVTATQCICKANYHCSQDCEYCLKDNPCFPGFEVKEKANRKSDTKCRPCPPRHFSNETSITVKCKQRTNCSILGLMEKIAGNATTDAVCIDATSSLGSDDTMLIIVVGIACGCTILMVFICAIIFHRKFLATLTESVQQRFTHTWCNVSGRKRNKEDLPANLMIKSDNHGWDPESDSFLPHKNLVKATDEKGSVFCTCADCPDYSPLWNPHCRIKTLWTAKHSLEIPNENPDTSYNIRNEGGDSTTIVLVDASSGTSLNPLMSEGYEIEESIQNDSSTQEDRKGIYAFRNIQKQAPATDSPSLLSSLPSRTHCPPNHDCHMCCQSNSSSSAQEAENIHGLDSSNHTSNFTNLSGEYSHNTGNSVPSGFSGGSNIMYDTSGQSVSNASGSVIFNVIVKVNNSTDEHKRVANDKAKFSTEDDDRYRVKEEKPGSRHDSETGTGIPVQEQSKKNVPFPVQEEQTSFYDHRVNFPIQEQTKSRQSLEEGLILAGRTINQEYCCHPRVNTFPMQEDE